MRRPLDRNFETLYCVVGTRIIYDRKFLLDRRNSPIAQTPPAHLPVIPGVTSQNVVRENQKNEANNHVNNHVDKPTNGMSHNVDQYNLALWQTHLNCLFLFCFQGDDAQFEMDI